MPRPLRKPRTVCPFSGGELAFVEIPDAAHPGNSNWQVRGWNWVSTKLFATRELAEWWASHNQGEKPAFDAPTLGVKIREDDGTGKSLEKEAEDIEEMIEDLADEAGEVV